MRVLKFASVALFMGLMSFAVVSCDPKDDIKPAEETAYEKLAGQYSGTMTCTPVSEEEVEGTSETANLEIKDREIIFASFPYEAIIIAIMGEEQASAIIEAITKIPSYNLDFTAAFNEDKTNVSMLLAPKPLTLTIATEPEEEGGEPGTLEITATISSRDNDGDYTVSSKKLTFALTVEKVVVGGEELSEFVPLLLEFDMTKK